MAERNLNGKIIQILYTTEELSQEPLCDIIIDKGIVVYEKCENGKIKMKMGNGVNIWSELDYIGKESEINDELISSETTYSSTKVEDLSNNHIIFSDNDYKNIQCDLFKVADSPMRLEGSGNVIYNDELHVLGGYKTSELESSVYYTYDFENDKSVEFKDFPCSSINFSFVYNNEINIFGKNDTTHENTHYKLINDTWELVSTLPIDDCYDSSVVVYNNEVHLIGGYNSTMTHYKWNGSEWINVCTLPYEYCGKGAIVYNDELYILGGRWNTNITKFYKFNNDSSEWINVGELPFGYNDSDYSNIIIYNGEMHVFGDYNNGRTHYKWNGSEWIQLNNVPFNYIYNGYCYIIENKLEIINYNDIYYYDDINDEWFKYDNKHLTYYDFDSITFINGKLYMFFETGSWIDIFKHMHYKFDGSTWIKMNNLPYDFAYGSVITYNDEIHILGDMYYGNSTCHYKLNKDTLEWIEVSSIPCECFYNSAIVFDNKIHLLGGNEDGYNKHYSWNGEKWELESELPFYLTASEGGANSKFITYQDALAILINDYENDSLKMWGFFDGEWYDYYIENINYLTPNISSVVSSNENIYILCFDYNTQSLYYCEIIYDYDSYEFKLEPISDTHVGYIYEINALYNNDKTYVLFENNISKIAVYYKVSSYANKGCKLHIKNAFSISDNLETTDYGFIVTEDGVVEIGIENVKDYYNINNIFNDIYLQIDTRPMINDDSYSTYDTYSSYKIKKMIEDESIDVNASINGSKLKAVLNNKCPIDIKQINLESLSQSNTLTWNRMMDLPYDFYHGEVVILNNEIHLLGGYDSSTKHYKYDGVKWSKVSTLPYEFFRGGAVVFNDEIHIFGAYSYNDNSKKHYKFNSNTKEWESVSTLPYRFNDGDAVVLNGEIHLMGNEYYGTQHYKFDNDTNAWIEVSTIPYEFKGNSVVYNDEIHIFGSSSYSNCKQHYKFDNDTNAWVEVSTLPYYFQSGKVVVLNNEIHILGSNRSSSYYNYHYKWNGSNWSRVEYLPFNIRYSSVVVWEDELFVLGSYESDNEKMFYYQTTSNLNFSDSKLLNIKLENGNIIDFNSIEINDEQSSTTSTYSSSKIENIIEESIDNIDVGSFPAITTDSENLEINSLNVSTAGSTWNKVGDLPYSFHEGSSLSFNNKIHIFGSYYESKSYKIFYSLSNGLTWTKLDDLPYSFYEGSAIIYNGELYLLGGANNGTRFYKFNGSTWTEVGDLPYNFYEGSAVVYNNEIHIMGSGSYSYQKSHYKYDGTTWTKLDDLPYSFYEGSAVVYNNEIHIMGSNSSSYRKSHYKYDGTTWTKLDDLPYSFYEGSAVVYNDELYLLGGANSNDAFYKFNGSTWIELGYLPYYFYYSSSAVVYNNEIHIMGSGSYSYQKSHYKYDGTTWTKLDDLPYSFYEGSAIIYNGELYLLGSDTSIYNYCKSHYEYNGTTWTQLDDLPYSFYEGSAVVYNNEIHLLGSSSSTKSHYKFNGSTWAEVGELPYSFYKGSAVVYNNEIHLLGSSSSTKYHYKYDGTTWTKLDDLPYSFYEGSAVVYNNEIHIMGSNSSSYRKYHYKYDGTTWTKLDDLPYSFYEGSAVVYNDELYLLGSSYSGNYKSHYEYNGTTWTQLDVLPYDFYRGCAVIYNNEIHIMGSNSSSYYTEHYSFIITKDKLLSFTINKNITIPFVDIDDECSSTTSTYSSSKIEDLINETSTTINNALSESKSDLNNKINNIKTVEINDEQPSTTSTYSSSKIEELINTFDVPNNEISIFRDEDVKNIIEELYLPNCPISYNCSSCVVYNNELHVLGNSDDDYMTSHCKWNGSEWIKLDDLPYPFNSTTNNAIVWNNEIHILGGYNISSNDYVEGLKHYKFNGTEWTEVSTLPYEFYNAGLLVYNNEIHILGSNSPSYSKSHYKFNGTEWTEVSTLPYKFYDGCAVVYNDKINIISSYEEEYTSHYEFDSETSTWTKIAETPYDCSYGHAIVRNNEIHIYSGYDNKYGHIKYDGENWTQLNNIYISIYGRNGNVIEYDNLLHFLSNTNFLKLCNKYYTISAFLKKDSIINIYQDSFPISNNLIEVENGYKVTEDGIVEIGIYDDEAISIRTIINSINDSMNSLYDTLHDEIDNLNEQIEELPSINDSSASTTSTYSSSKIEELLSSMQIKNYYIGTTIPSNEVGEDGDLYLIY